MNIKMWKNLLVILLSITPLCLLVSQATALQVSGFQSNVLGKEMIGMDVSIVYNNTIQPFPWEDFGDGTAGVKGDWGSLTLASNKDTWDPDNAWVLSANSGINIYSLTLNGGNTVFDIIESGSEGTVGSANGFWSGNEDATYGEYVTQGYYDDSPGKSFSWDFRDEVNLTGHAFKGDVYNTLQITFDDENGNDTPFSNGDTLSWYLDTDLAVPEPSTILLFGTGLAGLGYFHRRKKQKHH